MFETLDKLMLAGLGAVSMTRERAEEIFDEYVSRGKVAKRRAKTWRNSSQSRWPKRLTS
jgi:polyhydroxyalkanoate synthesis regulator phasin